MVEVLKEVTNGSKSYLGLMEHLKGGRGQANLEQGGRSPKLDMPVDGDGKLLSNGGCRDKCDVEVGGQAVLGRQNILPTPWLTERHGYDPTSWTGQSGTGRKKS